MREVIGASQLIVDLTESYLEETLEAIGAGGHYKVIQKMAGQAILEFSNFEVLKTFYAIWRSYYLRLPLV